MTGRDAYLGTCWRDRHGRYWKVSEHFDSDPDHLERCFLKRIRLPGDMAEDREWEYVSINTLATDFRRIRVQ